MYVYFSYRAPEQCDAVVECYILSDDSRSVAALQSDTSAVTAAVTSQSDNTTDCKLDSVVETVCSMCQRALRDADIIRGNQ